MTATIDTTTRCYAGIGSRRTPAAMLDVCEQIAHALAQRGWRLRTGHAPGADQAFERGAGTLAAVFLPWPTSEQATPILGDTHQHPARRAFDIAPDHHPNWAALGRGGRALHARNCHQVLGPTLDQPAAFAVCWTPDGSLDGNGRNTGGTGQALRLCAAYSVPVFNLARPEHLRRIRDRLDLGRSRPEAGETSTAVDTGANNE